MAILRTLADVGETCACDLGQPGIGQPTLSHHLRVLRESGWVVGERRGTWVWYAIRPDAVRRFQQLAGRLGGRSVMATPVQPRRLTVMARLDP
jgi:ArsR family transcriptional regulator